MKINPTLLGFIKKELIQSLRDPKMKFLLFISPLFQLTVFGLALTSDITNVRIARIGSMQDTIVNEVYRDALASKWFIPAQTGKIDAFEMIKGNDADVVLVSPPEGTMISAEKGIGEFQVLINASNVLKAQAIESYLEAMTKKVSRRYFPPLETAKINMDIRVLYNPSLRSAIFMVPGVMSVLICLITVILTSMSLSKEKEVGTFEVLISAPLKVIEILLGKTVPFVILGLCNVPMILAVAIIVFDVPMRGSFWLLGFSCFVFVCVTVSIGTLISTVSKNQQQSMMAGFLFMFPAIQLSGMTFPVENMPQWLKVIAYLNPITYFLELLRNIMLKGGSLHLALTHLGALLVMGVGLSYVSYKRFKTTL